MIRDLENWIEFVKEEDCLLDIQIVDNTYEDIDIYGDIGENKLLFIVEDEDLFIIDKKYLKNILNLLETISYHSLNIYINNRWWWI